MKRNTKKISLFLSIVMILGVFFSNVPFMMAEASNNSLGIIIDGEKDDSWSNVVILGETSDLGFNGFGIDNLIITNDDDYLYFWVDAVNVPNWGENGMFINIALNVNETDSTVVGNPWGAQFNFDGTEHKPNYHIVMRVKNDDQVAGAAVYNSVDLNNPLLATWTNLKGAEFALNREIGFEGKIPLEELGLKDADILKAIVVLSGNNSGQHGAFDVIPQLGNTIATDWNQSGNQNVQLVYSDTYTITAAEKAPTLKVETIFPKDGQKSVSVDLEIIEVVFSEDISIVNDTNITINDVVYNNAINGTALTVEDAKLKFILGGKLEFNSEYRVKIPVASIKGETSETTNDKDIVFVFTTEVDPREEVVKSPVINEDGTVTFNAQHSGDTLNLVGSMNGWDNKGIPMTKNADGIFTVTLPLSPDVYEYKYFPVSGSWDNGATDSLNNRERNGNSLVVVPGVILDVPNDIQLGETVDLKAMLLNEAEEKSQIVPQWSIKEPKNGITIENGLLTVSSGYDLSEGSDMVLVANHNQFTTEKEIKIQQTMYEFIINYYRYDKNYTDWDMWLWQEGKDGKEYEFNQGVVGEYVRAVHKFTTDQINVITRPGNWSSQEAVRTIKVQQGTKVEVWIIEGETKVYYNESEVNLSESIRVAMMDSLNEINVFLSHGLKGDNLASFELVDKSNGEKIEVNRQKVSDRHVKLTVINPSKIDVTKLYEVTSSQYRPAVVTMRKILDNPKYFYKGNDLGLTYSSNKGNFKLWAPTAKKVSVALYQQQGQFNEFGRVTDHTGGQETEMTRASNGVWSVEINENLAGKFYMYRVEFADGTVNYAVDPYAKAVSANGQRTAIVDLRNTVPTNWRQNYKPQFISPVDAIIYEIHVRDLSISSDSGATNKGKFVAFTEEGTKGPNGVKTGIDHIKELGVTHVHLLPAYDFYTVDETKLNIPQYNWGYDPQNYNVPEGSYATDPYNPQIRVKEFKEMVQALHNNGLRVIMDVVYNHTYETGGSPFDAVVPGYFYRTDELGRYTNGSGCGNEVASERPMVRKYIIDSVKYWANEYNVDGFRFDLMGLIDVGTMEQLTNELHAIDPTILVYGEPWQAGGSPLSGELQTVKGKQKDKNFAVFNDNFRGAIKGGSDDVSKGFATGQLGREQEIMVGVKAAINDFANSPSEVINYVTAHDNLLLWDKVIKTQGLEQQEGFLNLNNGVLVNGGSIEDAVNGTTPHHAVDKNNVLANETVKRTLLANGIVLTSQGVPFIHAGEEILRTKFGDHNSYRSPDAINMLRWHWKEDFKPVFDYYQGLITLRKQHPAFRIQTKEGIEGSLKVLRQDNNVVAYQLADYANNDTWRNIIVIYNGNTTAREVSLPTSGSWNIVVNHEKAGTEVLQTIQGNKVNVEGLSMMVLYDQQEESYTPVLSTIELSSAKIGIEVGQTTKVVAIPKDQKGRPMDIPVTWTSLNETISTVEDGLIKAIADGNATILVEAEGTEVLIEVNVGTLIPTNIEVQTKVEIYETRNIELQPVVKDQYGNIMFNQLLEWNSNDSSIATITNGTITGVSVGTTFITLRVGDVNKLIEVKVNPYIEKRIRLQYDRVDQDYTDWNLWVWGTGVEDGQINFIEVVDGKAIANIRVAPGTGRVGFVLRKGTNWDTAKQDIPDDRFINVDPEEIVTNVKVTSMVGEIQYLPARPIINSPVIDGNSVIFNYRDEEATAVAVVLANEEYVMVKDEQLQAWTYKLEDVPFGEYTYLFKVTKGNGTTLNKDPLNGDEKDQKSLLALVDHSQFDDDIYWDYLFSDQGYNYMTPLEPSISQDVKVRLRAKAGDLSESFVLVREEGVTKQYRMTKVSQEFYSRNGFNSNAVEFWEGTIPDSANVKTYMFKVVSGNKVVWINGGAGENGKGVSNTQPLRPLFTIVPGFKTPDWAKEAVFYQIMVDRFRNGDTSNDQTSSTISVQGKQAEILQWGQTPYMGDIGNVKGDGDGIWNNEFYGGDLTGVREALPYFNQLGIDSLYLMPIFEAPSNHKYDPIDFYNVDKHFGGNKTFKQLTSELRSNSMNIMLDGVFNHTSDMHKWFDKYSMYPAKGAFEGEDSEFRNFYSFTGGLDTEGNPQYVGWHGINTLPKLNYADEQVRNMMYRNSDAVMKHYVEKYGINGWRFDAAEDLSVNGTHFHDGTQQHKESNHSIWREVRSEMKAFNPDVLLLGEWWGSGDYYRWLTEGDQWDSMMNYGGFYLPFAQSRPGNDWLGKGILYGAENVGAITRESLTRYPIQTALTSTNSLSTHDRPRFLDWPAQSNQYSDYPNDYETAGRTIEQLSLATVFQMTYVGAPMIYYGDEIGMKSDKFRNPHRADEGNDPYNRGTFNWDNWDEEQLNLVNTYAKLIHNRKNNKDAFVYGSFEELPILNQQGGRENNVTVYARYGNGSVAIVALNNEAEVEMTLEALEKVGIAEGMILVDILTGKEYQYINGKLIIDSLGQNQGVVLLPVANSVKVDEIKEPKLLNLNDPKEIKEKEKNSYTFETKQTDTGEYTVVKDDKGNNEVVLNVQLGKVLHQLNNVNSDRVVINAVTSEVVNERTINIPANLFVEANKLNKKIEIKLEDSVMIMEAGTVTVEGNATVVLKARRLGEEETKTLEGKKASREFTIASTIIDFTLELLEDNQKSKIKFNKPVNVIFSYDATKVNSEKLGVYYFNEELQKWEYIGGKVNQAEKVVLVELQHFSKYSLMEYDRTFKDVEKHWAKREIEILASKHVIEGVNSENFAPSNNVTRAEFTALIVRALKLKQGDIQVKFKDVEGGWYKESIEIAASLGLVKGHEGMFNPKASITREEMVVILIRALDLIDEKNVTVSNELPFLDRHQISTWSKEAIAKAFNLGLVKGMDEIKFAPKENTTRAQAAIVIYKLLEMVE